MKRLSITFTVLAAACGFGILWPQSLPTTSRLLSVSGLYLTDSVNYYMWPNFLCTLPVAGNFAWVNQGGATETVSNNALVMHAPVNNGTSWRLRTQSIGTSTTLTVATISTLVYKSVINTGIGFYETATGKMETISLGANSSPFTGLVVDKWNSVTSYSGTPFANDSYTPVILFLRIQKTGGNINFLYSTDGANFVQIFSEAQNAFFTTAPDKWFYGLNEENGVFDAYATLLSWQAQ